VLSCGVLLSCGASHGSQDAGRAPDGGAYEDQARDVEAYLDDLARALCEAYVQCPMQPRWRSVEDCVAWDPEIRSVAPTKYQRVPWMAVDMARRGELVLDPAAAAACLAELAGGCPRAEVNAGLWSAIYPFRSPCEQVFAATRPLADGQPCEQHFQCEAASYCGESPSPGRDDCPGARVCRRRLALGAYCDWAHQCAPQTGGGTVTCVGAMMTDLLYTWACEAIHELPSAAAGEYCGYDRSAEVTSFIPCAGGLVCYLDTCIEPLAPGESCSTLDLCAYGNACTDTDGDGDTECTDIVLRPVTVSEGDPCPDSPGAAWWLLLGSCDPSTGLVCDEATLTCREWTGGAEGTACGLLGLTGPCAAGLFCDWGQTCRPAFADGATCSGGLQCRSACCVVAGTDGMCTEAPALP